jgi:hypothetical protein
VQMDTNTTQRHTNNMFHDPRPIRDGTNVTLVTPDGKSVKYVLWNLTIDSDTGDWKFELKRPAPDDTIDYVLRSTTASLKQAACKSRG